MSKVILFCLSVLLGSCAGTPLAVDVGGQYQVRWALPSDAKASRRNVLVLSGGGADGAFGAGVLAGWSIAGTRPVFDVVTGISTGALQATPAFLGQNFDELLKAEFTKINTDNILEGNNLYIFVNRTGLYNLEPLRERLKGILSPSVLDQVALEHKAGRRLLVATTDLSNGRLVTWDMGAIAASAEPDRQDRYVGILLASAAVPGLIEPVTVRDAFGRQTFHGDGGVKAPFLFDSSLLGRQKSAATVWIIANGHVTSNAATTATVDGTLASGVRGLSQLLRSLMHTSLVAAYLKIQSAKAKFRLLGLPDTVPEAKSPLSFQPGEMKALFEAGYQLGRAQHWESRPPGMSFSEQQ